MTKTINLSLPEGLLRAIDQAAESLYASRSDYIRQAVIQQFKVDQDPKHERKASRKNTPKWAIRPSENDEYELADDYEL